MSEIPPLTCLDPIPMHEIIAACLARGFTLPFWANAVSLNILRVSMVLVLVRDRPKPGAGAPMEIIGGSVAEGGADYPVRVTFWDLNGGSASVAVTGPRTWGFEEEEKKPKRQRKAARKRPRLRLVPARPKTATDEAS